MARQPERSGLDALPEFATDREIATALVGPARAPAIVAMMPMFELEGFPKIDPRFSGRYVPAVRRWLDGQYGLTGGGPPQAGGGREVERWGTASARAESAQSRRGPVLRPKRPTS